jgi:molybdopterin converting factor small subunit
LNVKVWTAGALTHSLPSGEVVVDAEGQTVIEMLSALVARFGEVMARELMTDGRVRDGLAVLVNGRNVLSLPDGFDTVLAEGDQVAITIMIPGG